LPFVLQHKDTSQVYTCMLVNHYRLEYYGVKFWEDKDEAEQDRVPFLQEKGVPDPESWRVAEMEEGQMKISNVKLKNDPGYILHWKENERPTATKI
jgi:hypothetical protein